LRPRWGAYLGLVQWRRRSWLALRNLSGSSTTSKGQKRRGGLLTIDALSAPRIQGHEIIEVITSTALGTDVLISEFFNRWNITSTTGVKEELTCAASVSGRRRGMWINRFKTILFCSTYWIDRRRCTGRRNGSFHDATIG